MNVRLVQSLNLSCVKSSANSSIRFYIPSSMVASGGSNIKLSLSILGKILCSFRSFLYNWKLSYTLTLENGEESDEEHKEENNEA